MLTEAARRRLREILGEAGALGLLGPGPVDDHIDHGEAVAATIGDLDDLDDLGGGGPTALLDLGSGGGVPGLVVALAFPARSVTLLEGSVRRCAFLRTAAQTLADEAEIVVAEGRAEVLARAPHFEGSFGVVTARSFARPAVTAECACRFLAVDGRLIVTEPPEAVASGLRWDPAGLALLGFGPPEVSTAHGPRLAVVAKIAATPARFPRRVGAPEKRPLW